MIRIVRPIRLLAVLLVLLSGLLQPLAAAQASTCVREHGQALVGQQVHGSTMTAAARTGLSAPSVSLNDDHQTHEPLPDSPVTASAPCGTAAIAEEHITSCQTGSFRQLVIRGDQFPATPPTESLFRPPRPS
jgi:hypothetical protein